MTAITASELIERYDGFLIDAYGVLITSGGPVDGAAEFTDALRAARRPFVIVTNDASRSRERSMRSYARRGIEIPTEQIVTSGSLLSSAGIEGVTCTVLGTPDAAKYARDAGAFIVEAGEDADVVVVGDEAGYDFLPAVDATISMLIRRCRRGDEVRLLLPNPDVIYPKGADEFGIASGGVAALIEAALRSALGHDAPRFVPLGKPHPPIFESALKKLGTARHKTVMLGDQLETDIRGALAVGLDAALVLTGVGRPTGSEVEPTWILDGLS